MRVFKVLVIDDEENMQHMLESVLTLEGLEVVTASDGQSGIDLLKSQEVDVVLCDLKMPGMDGLSVLKTIMSFNEVQTVIMMSAYATVDTAVRAMKYGAYDFITKPFKTEEILHKLNKAQERDHLQKENKKLRSKVKAYEASSGFGHIVHQSSKMNHLLHFAQKAARHDSTILITGESGTGKELVAKGLQKASPRKDKQFITVNCGAIPNSLLESELFGYVKGAFTGADIQKLGIFAEADGGTLFLDEIGELPLDLQVKLLRVLQENEIRLIGSSVSQKIDVRIIAATAKDLKSEVSRGAFRQDLLYRLNVIELKIPPLRERSDDILLLAYHFIKELNDRFAKNIENISRDVEPLLIKYDWPGNVRELQNVIERAMIYADSQILSSHDFPDHIAKPVLNTDHLSMFDRTFSMKDGKRIMEHFFISKALKKTGGNKSRAAELLEISYPSLLGKIKELKL